MTGWILLLCLVVVCDGYRYGGYNHRENRPGTINRQEKASMWTVEVVLDNQVLCAGALVSNKLVLTLQQCVGRSNFEDYEFIIGGEVRRGVEYIIRKYDEDVVLVELEEKFEVASDDFKVIPDISTSRRKISHFGRPKGLAYKLFIMDYKTVTEKDLDVGGTGFCRKRALGPFIDREFCFATSNKADFICPINGGLPIMKNFRMKWTLIGLSLPCVHLDTRYAFGIDIGPYGLWIKGVIEDKKTKNETTTVLPSTGGSTTEAPTVWSQWGPWGACSVTCGGGTQSRSRTCPTLGACPGRDTQTRVCNPADCGAEVEWGAWESWSTCSVTCGGGFQSRSRECPRQGGCSPGEDTESRPCNTETCPTWSDWGSWSACSVTCGGGTQERSRQCPTPGACPGKDSQTRDCNTDKCTVWSAWGHWSDCSVTCGGGTQTRTRNCPGKPGSCQPGSSSQTRECNTDKCYDCDDPEECIDDLNSRDADNCYVCHECSAYADTYKTYNLQRINPEFEYESKCQEWKIPHKGDEGTDFCIDQCNRISGVVAIKLIDGDNYCSCLAGPCEFRIHDGKNSGRLLKRKCNFKNKCDVSCCKENEPCSRGEFESRQPYAYYDKTCKKVYCRCLEVETRTQEDKYRWKLHDCNPGFLFNYNGPRCVLEANCVKYNPFV